MDKKFKEKKKIEMEREIRKEREMKKNFHYLFMREGKKRKRNVCFPSYFSTFGEIAAIRNLTLNFY